MNTVQDGATDIVPAYLTAGQAAALLNVAKRTFTGMVSRGEVLQPTRFGRTGRSVRLEPRRDLGCGGHSRSGRRRKGAE